MLRPKNMPPKYLHLLYLFNIFLRVRVKTILNLMLTIQTSLLHYLLKLLLTFNCLIRAAANLDNILLKILTICSDLFSVKHCLTWDVSVTSGGVFPACEKKLGQDLCHYNTKMSNLVITKLWHRMFHYYPAFIAAIRTQSVLLHHHHQHHL